MSVLGVPLGGLSVRSQPCPLGSSAAGSLIRRCESSGNEGRNVSVVDGVQETAARREEDKGRPRLRERSCRETYGQSEEAWGKTCRGREVDVTSRAQVEQKEGPHVAACGATEVRCPSTCAATP
jgi:hypothetical protein